MARMFLNGNEIYGNVNIGSGGGGASAEAVLDNGQISTTSAYATASFSDISGYEYVLVRFRDSVGGTDYTDYKYIEVSSIGGGMSFTCTLHRSITCYLTTTTIEPTNYTGSYYDIYADIVGFVSDVFYIL